MALTGNESIGASSRRRLAELELAGLEREDAKGRDDQAEQERHDRANRVAQYEEGGGEEDLEEDRCHDHGREPGAHAARSQLIRPGSFVHKLTSPLTRQAPWHGASLTERAGNETRRSDSRRSARRGASTSPRCPNRR